MEEGKWKTDGVVFRYQKSRGNVAILGMEGSAARLRIPNDWERFSSGAGRKKGKKRARDRRTVRRSRPF